MFSCLASYYHLQLIENMFYQDFEEYQKDV